MTRQYVHIVLFAMYNAAYIEHVQALQAAALAAGSSAEEARLQYLADELTKVKLKLASKRPTIQCLYFQRLAHQ
jgi:hypothetical protein